MDYLIHHDKMKHLIKNNEIIKSGIPTNFIRDNGELFVGGYQNRTDIHYEDGWRDEIIPEYDSLTKTLGDKYYDQINDIVTYYIIDKSYPSIEDSKKNHYEELDLVTSEISGLFTILKNIYDPLGVTPENMPENLKVLVSMLTPLRTRAKTEIESLITPKEAYEYVIRGPEIENYIQTLKSFM